MSHKEFRRLDESRDFIVTFGGQPITGYTYAGEIEFIVPHQNAADQVIKGVKEYATSTPLDLEEVKAAVESLDACCLAIEYNDYLRRKERMRKIEGFLGIQRRFLLWVFDAKKKPWRGL